MKDSLSQSHISTRRTDGSYLKNFYQSVQKRRQEGRGGMGGEELEWQLQSVLRFTQTQ